MIKETAFIKYGVKITVAYDCVETKEICITCLDMMNIPADPISMNLTAQEAIDLAGTLYSFANVIAPAQPQPVGMHEDDE